MNAQVIPQSLVKIASDDRWVVWKWQERNGKLTKPPFMVRHGRPCGYAQNNKPQTWTSLKAAQEAAQYADGIGLQLLGLEGIAAVDLDDVRDADGVLLPWASDVIRRSSSYSEFTPSGKGARIVGRVADNHPTLHTKKDHPGGGHFEIYANLTDGHGRYITVSGDQIIDTPDSLADISEIVAELMAVGPKEADWSGDQASGQSHFHIDTGNRDLPGWVWDYLKGGGTGDRSAKFQSIVNALRPRGWSFEEALKLFEDHPQGPSAKFADRLERELRRSWEKVAASHSENASDLPADTVSASQNFEAHEVVLNARGAPVWCYQTAYATLCRGKDWNGALAYDELAGMVMLLKPIPGTTTPKTGFKPRELSDVDIMHATRWYNRSGFPQAKRVVVADAMVAVAHENVISPVRHYLEDLVWDGVPRVENLFITYCGAHDTEFNIAVGKAWMISAVARALNPGCKADNVPILEGSQGGGKSTFFRILAGDEWFHDSLGDLGGKDAAASLRGKWIIELPELASMKRTDIESTKAFLSRTTERYRPAYGRSEVIEPRRCVFAGTTNRQDLMSDETGGRRFWPVAVGDIRLDDLKLDRDQLWAEAVQLYRRGEKWWLDGDIEKEASVLVMDRSSDDPWTAQVLHYVDKITEVCTREILEEMGIEMGRQTRADALRVGGILTRAGWKRSGKFSSGQRRGLGRYVSGAAQCGFLFNET